MLAQGIKINFAHRTFSWSNEARGKAAVDCVIIGFSLQDVSNKIIYEYADIKAEPHAIRVSNVNPYLVDAPDVVLDKRSLPICSVPEPSKGSQPTDGGHLLLSEEEKDVLIGAEPLAEKWVRPFLGADEFINAVPRYCLLLVDCPPQELRKMPLVLARVNAVKEMRSVSKKAATRIRAGKPVLDARAAHPQASLADLYDPLTMPANLLKAHQALDKAVDAAYGYKGGNTDAARVAFLFERYQAITSLLPSAAKVKKVRKPM